MAQMMRPRLIGKPQATMVASAGGLIGVRTQLADSPWQYARNIRALMSSESILCALERTAGSPSPVAWQDETAGFYYVVVDAMLRTGFTAGEIAKIGGGNFLRVFGEAVKK